MAIASRGDVTLGPLWRRQAVDAPFDCMVFTCEHGGNDVPQAYKSLFRGQCKLLDSHRGWDIGALGVARALAATLDAPLHASTTTRLLIDLNRSLHAKTLWSPWSRVLEPEARQRLIESCYLPYRMAVYEHLAQLVEQGQRVLHLSVHSFTPVLANVVRKAEVGILYDPKRKFEAALALKLVAAVRATDTALQVRRNYPYRGCTDGFTTWLRQKLPATRYAGIEIETRQDLITTATGQRRVTAAYTRAIRLLMDSDV